MYWDGRRNYLAPHTALDIDSIILSMQLPVRIFTLRVDFFVLISLFYVLVDSTIVFTLTMSGHTFHATIKRLVFTYAK